MRIDEFINRGLAAQRAVDEACVDGCLLASGAATELAPQLVVICYEYRVPIAALLSWIEKGSPRSITGQAWLATARQFPKEHKEPK